MGHLDRYFQCVCEIQLDFSQSNEAVVVHGGLQLIRAIQESEDGSGYCGEMRTREKLVGSRVDQMELKLMSVGVM